MHRLAFFIAGFRDPLHQNVDAELPGCIIMLQGLLIGTRIAGEAPIGPLECQPLLEFRGG